MSGAYTRSRVPSLRAIEQYLSQNNPTVVPNPIGGPPEIGKSESNVVLRNSNLVIKIKPCVPHFEEGTSIFSLERAWGEYLLALLKVGFMADLSAHADQAISIVAQADSFPTDSFTNDFGESFLNQIADIGSAATGQLAQITGKRKITEMLKPVLTEIGSMGESMGDDSWAGQLIKGAAGYGNAGIDKLQSWADANSKRGNVIGMMANAANRILAGARVDFPMIWRNSSYNPTFSCTVRLYNPDVRSTFMTNKYIIGPLAAILTLALPNADGDDLGYYWPYFCKVECPGLFKINSGAISNVTVTKGGSEGIVSYNQRLGIVDVRIDFINLHNVMTINSPPTVFDKRPTLFDYLDNIRNEKSLESVAITVMADEEHASVGSLFSAEMKTYSPRVDGGNMSMMSSLIGSGGTGGFYG